MTRPASVIDADGHICEPEIVWTEYTSAKFRDDVLQIRTANGKSDLYIENRRLPFGAGAGVAEACVPGGMAPGRKVTWADILPGSYDPAARLEVMDEEHIDLALLFPSAHLLWGDIRDPAIAAETCRAYNDWMSDFCKTDPNRLFAMGIIPLQDINAPIPKPGDVWMGNLARERRVQGTELQLWSQGGRGGFTDPKAFGRFIFE